MHRHHDFRLCLRHVCPHDRKGLRAVEHLFDLAVQITTTAASIDSVRENAAVAIDDDAQKRRALFFANARDIGVNLVTLQLLKQQ